MDKEKSNMEKGFGFSGVVKVPKDYVKAQAIIKLVNLGFDGLYVSFERNYAGKYLILHNGKWHCTDSDYYLSKEEFTDFGKDVDAFLKSAEEKKYDNIVGNLRKKLYNNNESKS